jgi:phosphate transport system protein
VTPAHTALDERLREIERDLAAMARLAAARLGDALAARERADRGMAARVIAGDEEMDDLCLAVEDRVFRTQLLQAPVARDQRLLHVARIVCVALERVGDLASAVAELTPTAPPACAAAPRVQEHLDTLAALAVDSLRAAGDALAGGDPAALEVNAARAVAARRALRELVAATAECADQTPHDPWPGETVLLGRHLERVADNAKEIAHRLRFLASGDR